MSYDDLLTYFVTILKGYIMSRVIEFGAGCLALNFVDTLADRYGSPNDLIATPEELSKWVKLANIYSDEDVTFSGRDLSIAKDIREAVYTCSIAILENAQMSTEDVNILNNIAIQPDFRPQIYNGELIKVAESPVNAVLSVIAADAIRLLDKANWPKIRECPDCRMIFEDNSRRQNRKWCSSNSGCGNRAKVRRHRAMKAEAKSDR